MILRVTLWSTFNRLITVCYMFSISIGLWSGDQLSLIIAHRILSCIALLNKDTISNSRCHICAKNKNTWQNSPNLGPWTLNFHLITFYVIMKHLPNCINIWSYSLSSLHFYGWLWLFVGFRWIKSLNWNRSTDFLFWKLNL